MTLGNVRDPDLHALVRRKRAQIGAIDQDLAGAHVRNEPGDGVEGRGLAGAVRSQQRDHHARGHGDAHALQDHDVAVSRHEVFRFERHHSTLPR